MDERKTIIHKRGLLPSCPACSAPLFRTPALTFPTSVSLSEARTASV